MKKITFAIASLAIVAAAVILGAGTVTLFHDHTANKTHMAWKDVFETPRAMSRSVDAIVVARHIGTSPGRVAFGENPEDAVPFELNHFVVENGLKGLAAGASFTLERVGGDLNGTTIHLDADGGPYVPGQLYALFVNKQPESEFYYLVNDEGRYSVNHDQQLVPVRAEGQVSSRLAGVTLGAFATDVRGALRREK